MVDSSFNCVVHDKRTLSMDRRFAFYTSKNIDFLNPIATMSSNLMNRSDLKYIYIFAFPKRFLKIHFHASLTYVEREART